MAFRIGEPEEAVMSDINVTPLVDVMLVLLIIFMVTAPMLHQGIQVALPRAQAESLPLRTEEPLIVTVNREGIVYLGQTPIHPTQLAERLLPVVEARGDDETVFLKADREVPYGRVIDVLDTLHRGGIVHVGMVTELPEDKASAGGRRRR